MLLMLVAWSLLAINLSWIDLWLTHCKLPWIKECNGRICLYRRAKEIGWKERSNYKISLVFRSFPLHIMAVFREWKTSWIWLVFSSKRKICVCVTITLTWWREYIPEWAGGHFGERNTYKRSLLPSLDCNCQIALIHGFHAVSLPCSRMNWKKVFLCSSNCFMSVSHHFLEYD